MRELDKARLYEYLNPTELDFSYEAGNHLANVEWTKKMLDESKIKRALSRVLPKDIEKVREIKSSLFEVRFAYAIYNCGLEAQHEFKTNIGTTSVDFRLYNPNKPKDPCFLIELTSLKVSKAIEEETYVEGNFFSTHSTTTSWDTGNSLEVRELKKAQNVIFNKVSRQLKKTGMIEAIKFPIITNNQDDYKIYHILIVDMRGFNMGIFDSADYLNIAYGSDKLNEVYQRYWIEDGKRELIRGVFDSQHPDPRSQILQQRIHAIGFINECNFIKDEMLAHIKLYPNLNFLDFDSIRSVWPLKLPNI